MHGGMVGQQTAAHHGAALRVDRNAFTLDRVPSESADAGEFQASAGFNHAHHAAKRIHMPGQRAAGLSLGVLAWQHRQQRAFFGHAQV